MEQRGWTRSGGEHWSASKSWGKGAGDVSDELYLFTVLSRYNFDKVEATSAIQID